MLIDGHIHLENGPLTIEYLDKFVQRADEIGLSEIHILDHTHRFFEFYNIYEGVRNTSDIQRDWLAKKAKNHLSEYMELIKQARKKDYPVKVLFGLEVCYTSESEEKISNILKDYQFDFLVGAVHSVFGRLYDMKSFSLDLLWNKYDVDVIYEEYYNEIKKLIKSKLFTQVAHPDTIKLFNIYPTYSLYQTYEEIIDLAIENDLYLENNFGCYYRYGHKDLGLSEEFLSLIKGKGAKIMLASDAHVPEHVGQCFNLYLEKNGEKLPGS